MKENIYKIYILLFLFSFIQVKAQYKHIDVFLNDSSFQLINKLVNAYKPITVLDYSQARVKMYTEIYNLDDSVSCIYTKHTLYLDPASSDPIGYLIKNGDPNGINCEHTFPQSKGADEGNAKSDMHHLFPARAAANEARSNFPFGDIKDDITMEWFYRSNSQSTKPNQFIDEYSESINGLFEPREDFKGNVARAVFYFFTMYELQADRIFFERMKPVLCNWHIADPVDSLEWERTFQIANYQEQKPNPFVLDCSLAKRSYCQTPIQCMNPIANEDIILHPVHVYPNPIGDEINIILENNLQGFEFILMDITGKPMLRIPLKSDQKIFHLNVESLTQGTYLYMIVSQKGNLRRGIVVKL